MIDQDYLGTEFTGDSGNRYRIVSTIGSGSHGTTVFRAVKDDGVLVAVKVIRNSASEHNAIAWCENGRLIEREWEISQKLRALKHDHLLLIDDHAVVEGAEYHIMLLAESTLKVKVGKLGDVEILAVVQQLARALAELVAASVVHRDIKPSNILFQNGAWKLADFGISKDESRQNTATWTGSGTLDYRAPEVFVDGRENLLSDLYALGCVLYELRTGRPPFADHKDIRRAHEVEIPAPIDDIDPRLDRLIHHLLAKQPAVRPQSPEEVLRLALPVGAGSPLGQRYLRLASRYARAEGQTSLEEARKGRLRRLAAEAVARLENLLNQAVRDLETVPMDVEFIKDEHTSSWLIRLYGHQLSITLVGGGETADDLVCMGVLHVLAEGEQSGRYPTANLVCEEADETLRWSMLRFTPNQLAIDSERIGQQGQWTGLKEKELWTAWARRRDAIKPAVFRQSDLTAEELLETLISEAER